jgi:Holliday junction resolvase-like predicted endonuclease
MNTSSSSADDLRHAAEYEAQSLGLRILDRNWTSESGDHALALVAAGPKGTLVLIDVRDPSAPGAHQDLDDISEERAQELFSAGQAWLDEHQAEFQSIRVDTAGATEHGFEYETEVA